MMSSMLSRWFLLFRSGPTSPFTALGRLSTYCGLMIAYKRCEVRVKHILGEGRQSEMGVMIKPKKCLEVVLNDFEEVILELGAAEVGEDLSPVRLLALLIAPYSTG